MTGRLLEAVRIVPPALWRHLGEQFGVAAPDLASLRSMYQRRRTLFEHRDVACETLGFHSLSDAQGVNLRGVFSFPIEQYAEQLLPSLVATKSRGIGG